MTHPNRSKARILCCALLSLATALGATAFDNAAAAKAEKVWSAFTFTTGLDYTVGKYGSGTETSVLYMPFVVRYEYGPWIGGLTVPFVSIDGDGSVVGGTDGTTIVKGGGSGTTVTNSGLGDMVARLSYGMFPNHKRLPLVELTGKLKIPTADETRGLGTGEFDYSLQVDVSKKIRKLTPFATLGYRFVGEPAGVSLNDIFFLSLGAGYRLHKKWSAGLILDYRQSTSNSTDDPIELTPYLVWRMHRDWKLNSYALLGLSNGSPDYGVGFQVTYTLER